MKDAGTSATLFDRQYDYNPANQIASITEPTRSRAMGYDNIDRLTSVTDATDTLFGNESNSYDAVNRLTTLTDDASQNFTYGYS